MRVKEKYVPIPDPIQAITEDGIINWYGQQAPRFYKGWQSHRAWLAYHTGSASTPCREGYELVDMPYDMEANTLAH